MVVKPAQTKKRTVSVCFQGKRKWDKKKAYNKNVSLQINSSPLSRLLQNMLFMNSHPQGMHRAKKILMRRPPHRKTQLLFVKQIRSNPQLFEMSSSPLRRTAQREPLNANCPFGSLDIATSLLLLVLETQLTNQVTTGSTTNCSSSLVLMTPKSMLASKACESSLRLPRKRSGRYVSLRILSIFDALSR